MDRAFETVMEEVMALDRDDQIAIAEKIMANVSSIADNAYSDEFERERRAELRRRVEAYRSGEMKAGDASEMFSRVRKMIAEARKAA